MGLSARRRIALQNEGIISVEDLAEFDDDLWTQISANLRNPAYVPSQADANVYIRPRNFIVPARSLMRLKVAAELTGFYASEGRPLTAMSMNQIVSAVFALQWKSSQDRKKEYNGVVPKITRTLGVVKWVSVFTDYCGTIIGVRDVPLTFVLRDLVAVTNPPPGRLRTEPYSVEHGSVQAELIARVSHSHPVFGDDSGKIWDLLEEATRTTPIASTIAPFKATKNGRGAYLSVILQHAGVDKWEAIVKKADHQMRASRFKGNTQLTLEKHCNQHRQNFIYLQEAGKYVKIQIPTNRTRVTLLLDSIECVDAVLLAQLANIRASPTLQENFEASVTLILPADPVARKAGKNETNRNLVDSDRIQSTGVQLRFYPKSEFDKLAREQVAELRAWRAIEESQAAKARDLVKKRKTSPSGSSNQYKKKQKLAIKKQVSSAIAAARKKNSEYFVEANALISSLVQGIANKSPTLPPPTVASADAQATVFQLQTIMRKFQAPKLARRLQSHCLGRGCQSRMN